MRADDSDGTIGGLCRDVLDLHRRGCAAGVADSQKLAKWMVKFAFEDQDFFEIDPVAYAEALGDKGLAVYRREVAERSHPADAPDGRSEMPAGYYGGFPDFAAKYAAERLAIIDRDVDRLIELVGGDLSSPYQFQRVPMRWSSSARPTTCCAGRAVGSPRPPGGRWASSTAWPPTWSPTRTPWARWWNSAVTTPTGQEG